MEQILINYTKNEENNTFMLCVNGLGKVKVFNTEEEQAKQIVEQLKQILNSL